MLDLGKRFELLRRPFSEQPYRHSFAFYKICYYLACIEELQIEETFVVSGQVRMEIYSLVMYIYARLRGKPGGGCNFERFFQAHRLHRL